jgi:hypothetical protein
MNIVIDAHLQPGLDEKYVLLELDTLQPPGGVETVTAYCLIEKLSLEEMFQFDQWRNLHQNLMKNYRLRNWNYCAQAISHLKGRWSGELDSFYQTLQDRIDNYASNDPGSEWTGIIDRSAATA